MEAKPAIQGGLYRTRVATREPLANRGYFFMAQKRRKATQRESRPPRKVVSASELRRMQEEADRNRPPFPAEGLARCMYNDGMEDDLQIGEVVYLREIPNMGGHCIVLRNKKVPLVGYHLDRFQLLSEDEV
jgi:hypothetical protein